MQLSLSDQEADCAWMTAHSQLFRQVPRQSPSEKLNVMEHYRKRYRYPTSLVSLPKTPFGADESHRMPWLFSFARRRLDCRLA